MYPVTLMGSNLNKLIATQDTLLHILLGSNDAYERELVFIYRME